MRTAGEGELSEMILWFILIVYIILFEVPLSFCPG